MAITNTNADMDAAADHAARIADQQHDLAANPPPTPREPEKPIYADSMAGLFAGPPQASEADVKAVMASYDFEHDELVRLGQAANASAKLARRGAYEASIRADLGIAAPTVNPEAKVLDEIGRVPAGAKPSDYRPPDLSPASWLEGDARTRVGNAMVELAAANQLSQQAGDWVAAEILKHSGEMKAITDPLERQAFLSKGEQTIENMSGGYVEAKERLAVAREFLSKTEFGRASIETLLKNPGFVMTVWNLHSAKVQFDKSKRR